MIKDLDSQELGMTTEIHNLSFEVFGVEAGTGGGFGTTSKLRVLKYDKAVNGSDVKERKEEIQNEFKRMKKIYDRGFGLSRIRNEHGNS